jgi:hypothetical protein
MPWPRFKSKKAWTDRENREWHPAGPLPEWEELDLFEGSAWYVLDHKMEFPEEGSIVIIHKDESQKNLRVGLCLDVSTDGFKRLLLISEVYSRENF